MNNENINKSEAQNQTVKELHKIFSDAHLSESLREIEDERKTVGDFLHNTVLVICSIKVVHIMLATTMLTIIIYL